MRIVRRADRVIVPWRNGLGVTEEIWREGAGPAGFALRLSEAVVATDGPFSAFPGTDRVITLVRGAGFILRFGDGRVMRCAPDAPPFAFAGEDPVDCTLLDGPVRDLNVMVDRAVWRASVAVVRHTWDAPATGRAFFLADGDAVVDGVALADGDLAALPPGARVSGSGWGVALTPAGAP